MQTGLLFLPFAVGFSVASACSGRVTAKLGPLILNLGTGSMVTGLRVLLAGCGFGLPLGPLTAAFAATVWGRG